MTLDEFEKSNKESESFYDRTYSGMGWPDNKRDEFLLKERIISIERKIDMLLKCNGINI